MCEKFTKDFIPPDNPAIRQTMKILLSLILLISLPAFSENPGPVDPTKQAELIEQIRQGKKHLEKTDLRWADLTEANLYGAVLTWANLYRAKLRWADLFMADLTGAVLIKADLT